MSDEHGYHIPGDSPQPAHDPREIEKIARVCHEVNRALQVYLDEDTNPPWEDAPDWQKESSKSGVRHALEGATPRQSHENWMKDREKDGWKWGPTKDEDKKEHPCLVPYDELPADQRVKDKAFTTMVRLLHPEEPTPIIASFLVIVNEDGAALGVMHPEDHLRFEPKREADLPDVERACIEIGNDVGRIRATQMSAEPIAQTVVGYQQRIAQQMQQQMSAEQEARKLGLLDAKGGYKAPGGARR